MTVAHGQEHAATTLLGPAWLPVLAVLLVAAAYAAGLARLRARGAEWPAGRVVAAAGGLVALGAAVAPPLADADAFPVHVVQHLLLAMVAPALLALAAPVLLALRTLPGPWRRRLLTVVHSRAVRVLMWPPVVLVLDLGGMYAYYLTGLFELSHQQPVLHVVVHAHMLLAGCLLAWLLVGADPVPHRPSVGVGLLVLLVAAGAHDVLAKLMYAYALPTGAGPRTQIEVGAQIMYVGGDLVEVGLAVALMWAWYRRTGRALAHERRRAAAASVSPAAGRRDATPCAPSRPLPSRRSAAARR